MALSAKIHALGTKNDAGEDCKGTLSVYGLNARFPITLYPGQWRELARVVPTILKMIDAGEKAGTLSMTPPKKAVTSNGKVAL